MQLAGQAAAILWSNLIQRAASAEPTPEILPLPTLQNIDSSLARFLLQDIAFNLSEIVGRLQTWFSGLLRGNAAFDSAVVSLLWGLALWMLAVWAAWFVRRRSQPLPGILPAGVLFAASLSFTGASGLLIVPVVTGALLLLAASQLVRQEQRWQGEHIDYAEDIPFDQVQWAGGMVMGIVILSILVSYISPQKIFETLRELGQERSTEAAQVGESLGLKPWQPTPASPDELSPGVLPRQHLLGGGPELNQQIVMLVEVEGLQVSADGLPQDAPTYYWRNLVYDIYTGHGWGANDTNPSVFNAGALTLADMPPGYSRLRQRFHLLDIPADTLYHTGLLLSADVDFQVEARPASETEIDYFAVTPAQKPSGNMYRVDSLIQQPGLAQLQAVVANSPSGVVYPQWIAERYLQLPSTLPADLVRLANELTAKARTPYEKASAIESYLRKFPYTLDVSQPPADRDVVEYFLFDLKRGYCDYYATAMVVLARAAGLPARLVTGYATGSFDPRIERFVVTANDAHSWVEIYFPGLGWVEFEPTGGRSPFERPEETRPRPEIELGDLIPKDARSLWRSGLRWLGRAGALLAGLGLLAYCIALLDAWHLRRLGPQGALRVLYQRMYRHARRLEISLPPGETPHEFSTDLSQRIAGLSAKPRWQKALTPASQETQQVVDMYTRSIYGPQPAGKPDQEQALLTWRGLARRLWLARWLAWRSSFPKRRQKKA